MTRRGNGGAGGWVRFIETAFKGDEMEEGYDSGVWIIKFDTSTAMAKI